MVKISDNVFVLTVLLLVLMNFAMICANSKCQTLETLLTQSKPIVLLSKNDATLSRMAGNISYVGLNIFNALYIYIDHNIVILNAVSMYLKE